MFARFASALAIGFIGAYPFASASGLAGLSSNPRDPTVPVITTVGGIILFILTLGLAGPTLRMAGRVAEILGRVVERPKPPVAIAMMAFGLACCVAAMAFQFNAAAHTPLGLTMNLGGNQMGFNGGTQIVTAAPGSFVLGILTILTFLLGASLIGLGIWASLKPQGSAVAARGKPAVPEFAEVATGAVS